MHSFVCSRESLAVVHTSKSLKDPSRSSSTQFSCLSRTSEHVSHEETRIESLHLAGLPTPSWELSHGNCAKALISWFLDRGHRVRLASQSSEHLWLLTVEGSQASALPIR
ncbi:unnamed protein product [Sphenostylis stenocarpa]|uniref:Uncharacterized protein n=1 Tax=Sphenostylis stenocarpa TaxID=92480 RepID=A0AA86RPL1_9FABA|nr:unnamed protein product [Sphenostylis stenocarpa]